MNVLLNAGGGRFRDAFDYAAAGYRAAVAAADLDGDGVVDLAVVNFASSQLSVLLGNGDGTFRPAVQYPESTNLDAGPTSLVVTDLNGDGKPDLAIANYNVSTVSVLFGKGDGSFYEPVDYRSFGPDSGGVNN